MGSEFGKGLTYCLGLFLAHAERGGLSSNKDEWSSRLEIEMWFNAASDHLYELQVPMFLSLPLRKKLKVFQKKCLEFGHGFNKDNPTDDDKSWAIQEAKDLLRQIDFELKVKVEKGDFE